jgi:3-dehydroquinate dehydratase/shikimate dehydrogenase
VSKKVIIVETSLSEFLSETLARPMLLSRADIVHFNDGLVTGRQLKNVLDCLGHCQSNRISKSRVKLSMRLRSPASDCAQPNEWLCATLNEVIDTVDYIELDAQSDLTAPLLSIIPPNKRIITRKISRQDGDTLALLLAHYQSDSTVEAHFYRYICDDGLGALEFLHQLGQTNVIAYDAREENLWSRICACYKGASVIFACFGKEFDKDSRVSLDWLQSNYNIAALPHRLKALYGIIGASIAKSFSPLVHNTGLRALKSPTLYLPFNIDSLDILHNHMARLAAIDLPILGLTVTAPLKAIINTAFNANRAVVEQAQSANVLILRDDETVVETTDDSGLVKVIEQHNITVKGKRIAVIGCGCSGRVSAYTLTTMGAQVTLFNRSPAHSASAQALLQLPCKPLASFDAADFDVLINTVPFTREADITFAVNRLNPKAVYIDFVYNPYPNKLLVHARSRGLTVIDGLNMLQSQLLSQFYCLTGHHLPVLASKALERILNDKRKAGGALMDKTYPCLENVN